MRVTIVTPDFPYPNPGNIRGSRRYAANIAKYLKEVGIDVKIITTFSTGNKKYDNFNGIPILRIKESKFLFGKLGHIFYLDNITFALNLFRKKHFEFFKDSDILILFITIGFTRYFKFKSIPITSVFFHYNEPKSLKSYLTVFFLHFWEKKQFKHHQNIITISNFSKNGIIKFYNLEEEKIKVIPPGIDNNKFNPSNYSEDIRKKYGKNILLHSGFMVKRKRIPVLLKALTYVIKEIPDIHLVLLGKGPQLNYYKKLSKDLGIQNNVSFLGFVEEDILLKYYATSDILVFPSELEGFGQVILEAMASGTPVICTDKPPMSEIIEDGGMKFNLNNSKDLAKKIIKLLENREDLKKYRENALKIAMKYKWENIAKTYIDHFKEIKVKQVNRFKK